MLVYSSLEREREREREGEREIDVCVNTLTFLQVHVIAFTPSLSLASPQGALYKYIGC
jgi:hypothetical protein